MCRLQILSNIKVILNLGLLTFIDFICCYSAKVIVYFHFHRAFLNYSSLPVSRSLKLSKKYLNFTNFIKGINVICLHRHVGDTFYVAYFERGDLPSGKTQLIIFQIVLILFFCF